MQIDLSGLCVLLTGASRGIGKALARALAASGARVAIHYHQQRDEALALAESLGAGHAVFKANLADANETALLFDSALAHFGRIDVLINNAGIAISSEVSLSDEHWIDDWQRTLAVNLQAAALLCKKAILHFSERGGGRIINISSRAAFRGDTSDYLAYAASKGGMVALTRSIARAYGKVGIKAFDIAPGFTRTDMAQLFIEQYGESFALNDIALQKLTEPEDIAPMVVLLASGLADHATGTSIQINAASYVH